MRTVAILSSFCAAVAACWPLVAGAAPTKANNSPQKTATTLPRNAIQLTPKPRLSGFVDLHTHPMSHLGFGGKALHGAPDATILMPKGTRGCNKDTFRPSSMADALGDCNSTHGGWGADNTCGDYIRAAIISKALDKEFQFNVGPERNLHGDHEHAGFPNFDFWPHHTSVLHQQMWWEWIRRAKEGGLRVMVALAVNSETLAQALNGDAPFDDKSVADLQIAETIKLVERHPEFMQIAYSASDVRRIVSEDKLAVILGVEVDKIGNLGKPGVTTNEQTVRAAIRHLHGLGVRYAFPIHLIDNAFGGAAVYELLFNLANRNQNGYMYKVTTDRNIGYSAVATTGPLGAENGAVLGIHGLLTALGEIPVLGCINHVRCFPAGKLSCCGNYQWVTDLFKPTPEFDIYRTIAPGHVNALGLTPLGAVAITEMMKLGMIIDVDHMSERALRATVALAQAAPGGYPLVIGHNGERPPKDGNERGMPGDIMDTIFSMGGMLGLGMADTTPAKFAAGYEAVLERGAGKVPSGAIAMGSDANGLENLPQTGRSFQSAVEAERASQAFYTAFTRDTGLERQVKPVGARPGNTHFDYIKEGGVSHYGLMPEFVYDVKTKSALAFTELMNSAEYFATMWSKIERRSRDLSQAPTTGKFTFNVPPLTNLCPSRHVGGDTEFGGHGPTVNGRITLAPSADGSSLQARITLDARETTHDWSQVQGDWTVQVGDTAPAGTRFTSVNSATTSTFNTTLNGGGRNEVFEGCDGGEHVVTPSSGPVSRIVIVGDTGGGDISTDSNCNCDTRIVRIEFKTIEATLSPR